MLWFRASYLYRKIILSGREAGQSRAASSLTLGSLVGWASLPTGWWIFTFINRVFLNITKRLKLALFIEKYNSLSKKTVNEHITVCWWNQRERERARERILYRWNDRHRRERIDGDASPSMISDKLILPTQFQCLEMSCQCVNIVQGDGNTVFSHLAILVHSKPARESFIPSGMTPGLKELLCWVLPERFPGYEG